MRIPSDRPSKSWWNSMAVTNVAVRRVLLDSSWDDPRIGEPTLTELWAVCDGQSQADDKGVQHDSNLEHLGEKSVLALLLSHDD